MISRKQPPPMPARRPSNGLAHAGGPPECPANATLKTNCAAINAIPASTHAQIGTILISALSPVRVSFCTCINLSALSLPFPRLLAVIGEVGAASQQQHTYHQRRRDEEKHKAGLPNQGRDSGPFPHPGKEPPQKRDGEGCRKTHAQTSHRHHPHAFPRLSKPGSVKAYPHLRGPHQAGMGGQRQRTQSANHPVCRLRIVTAGFAFIYMSAQPKLLRVRKTIPQSDQFPCLLMCVP